MKTRLLCSALLAACCLLCACAPSDPSSSSSGSGSASVPEASTSQPQADTSQEDPTYTEADVQAAFHRSDAAKNATILDCVVAEDQDGGTDQRMDPAPYKLSYQKDGVTITFKALGNDGEETDLASAA